jgi:hypothetical protein
MSPLRRALLLALPLLLSACASAPAERDPGTDPTPTEERSGPEIAITVRNNLVVPSPLTVRIRPEIAGGLQILGNISPGREQTFRYNPQVVRGNYRLTARATGGGDITSTPFQLQGVSEVRWNVQQNSLQVITN